MNDAEKAYITTALEAIKDVKTDAELVAWDDDCAANPLYLSIPPGEVRKLNDAYRDKLAWILGVGA